MSLVAPFGFWGRNCGPVYAPHRVLSGWKYSLVIPQSAPSEIVSFLILDGVLLLHSLEHFLLGSADATLLTPTTCHVTDTLSKSGIIINPTSTLNPEIRIFFLGKWLELTSCTITSHGGVFLQRFAAWLRLAGLTAKPRCLTSKVIGVLHWCVRPRLVMGPPFIGAFCWVRCGTCTEALPLHILQAFSTVMALLHKKWTPPAAWICCVFNSISCKWMSLLFSDRSYVWSLRGICRGTGWVALCQVAGCSLGA